MNLPPRQAVVEKYVALDESAVLIHGCLSREQVAPLPQRRRLVMVESFLLLRIETMSDVKDAEKFVEGLMIQLDEQISDFDGINVEVLLQRSSSVAR